MESNCKWNLPQLLDYPLQNIIKMVKRIRMAGRVARMSNSKTHYAIKHGEYVVAVEHVLDDFSSSGTRAAKYINVFPAVFLF
jgi:hypothetical protein